MRVNGKPLSEYGGKLKMDYKISGCELDVSIFHGRRRSFFTLLNKSVGLKTLKLPVVFNGKDEAETERKKSLFEMAALGKSELIMDDGFKYSVVLTEIGQASYPSSQLIEVEYIFTGVRHGEYVVAVGNSVHCDSTLPDTDCILTVTVSADGTNYKIGSVTFLEVSAGEVLTVDGINGRILVNGIPAAERAEWTEFPKLAPGLNEIACADTLTVEFYPVYF